MNHSSKTKQYRRKVFVYVHIRPTTFLVVKRKKAGTDQLASRKAIKTVTSGTRIDIQLKKPYIKIIQKIAMCTAFDVEIGSQKHSITALISPHFAIILHCFLQTVFANHFYCFLVSWIMVTYCRRYSIILPLFKTFYGTVVLDVEEKIQITIHK
jgi:hypothetical protein